MLHEPANPGVHLAVIAWVFATRRVITTWNARSRGPRLSGWAAEAGNRAFRWATKGPANNHATEPAVSITCGIPDPAVHFG